MEHLQEFIYTHLPPSLLSTLTTHTTTYYKAYSTILRFRKSLFSTINSIFNPLLTRLIHEPDIASFLLLVVLLYISMKLLDFMWRSMLFWARMVLRIALLVVLVGLGFWVWSRGPQGWFNDLRWIGQVWWEEYEDWQLRTQVTSLGRHFGSKGPRGKAKKSWR